MVFLTPIILFGLLAALIPIAIHLIRKEKPPKLMFSTIRFLKKTSKKLVLFQQLQQIFLLLLRSLVLILLVIAFARPLVDQTVARLLDSDPQSAVVLLDLSMSMQYEDTFERAKEEALELLNGMTNGDEVALVAFSGSAEIVREPTTDIDSLIDLVNGMDSPGYGSTRYFPQLRLADQFLETAQFDNREVYLISDFQSIASDEAEDGWKLAPGVAFTTVDVGVERSENLAITDVRSPEQLLADTPEQQILARVRSTGSSYLESGDVSLLINGSMVDRRPIDLSDQSEAVVDFTASFEEEGSYSGEIRVSGDNFMADNSYFFNVDVLPKIRVLLVNGEASENWFEDEGHWFGLAVSGASSSPFELQTIEPAEVNAAALRQSDVAVLLNVGAFSTAQAQALNDYVTTGGSVLFAPGDRVEPNEFNALFEDISPAEIQSQNASRFDDYLVIADYDRRHPILSPLRSDWSARFEEHFSLRAYPDSEVLMQFDSAEPAFVERQVGEGRSLLFASSLDLEWNNLALQGLFLPFVHETLRHLVNAEDIQREFQVGESFSIAETDEADTVRFFDAEGVTVPFSASDNLVTARSPGLFTAQVGQNTARYAVNFLPRESNFAKSPPSNLYDRIINPDTNPIQSRQVQTEQLIQELEGPQRLWWWILSLVILLIFAEALIANRTYR